jgi:hypothetical protein
MFVQRARTLERMNFVMTKRKSRERQKSAQNTQGHINKRAIRVKKRMLRIDKTCSKNKQLYKTENTMSATTTTKKQLTSVSKRNEKDYHKPSKCRKNKQHGCEKRTPLILSKLVSYEGF